MTDLELEGIRESPSLGRGDAVGGRRAVGLHRDWNQAVLLADVADVELDAPIDVFPDLATTVANPEIDVRFGRAFVGFIQVDAEVTRPARRGVTNDDFILIAETTAHVESTQTAFRELVVADRI